MPWAAASSRWLRRSTVDMTQRRVFGLRVSGFGRGFGFRLSRGRAGVSMGLDACEVRLCPPCVRVCACVSRVCPGSPRCIFTGNFCKAKTFFRKLFGNLREVCATLPVVCAPRKLHQVPADPLGAETLRRAGGKMLKPNAWENLFAAIGEALPTEANKNKKENRAARLIQDTFRGHADQSTFQEMRGAAIFLQAAMRRRKAMQLLEQKKHDLQTWAALKIQDSFRRYLQRKKRKGKKGVGVLISMIKTGAAGLFSKR